MLIDTHAHLNFNAFRDDFDEVIKRSLAEKIWMINVGTNYETSKRAVEIAEKYEKGIYAAIGLHPIHLKTRLVKIKNDPAEELKIKTLREDFYFLNYENLASSKKVVAIGEIGLDYWYRPKTKKKLELFKEKQRTLLCQQLNLTKKLNLPIVFHCRLGHQDLLEILKSEIINSNLSGVIHCFTGNLEEAQKYLEMGFYLGFNGLIYKLNFDEIIKKVPLEKILIETDCPYLAPPTSALAGGGIVRNEPIYLKHIAEKIAKLKNLEFEKVAEITTQNAKKLFNFSEN